MYWDIRDLKGHFALRRDDHEPCPHHCCQGRRRHPVGRPVEYASARSQRLYRKLEREHQRAVARRPARARAHAGRTRADDRADMALAQHAQVLRAERHALGYKKETAIFYGSDKFAPGEHTENRLTQAGADAEAKARRGADRAARSAHARMTSREQEEIWDQFGASGW